MDNCLDNDINLNYAAAWYGNAERVLGEIAEGRRGQFYLVTAVRTEGKKAGEAQIARSFERLKADYIDPFQVDNMIDWQPICPPCKP